MLCISMTFGSAFGLIHITTESFFVSIGLYFKACVLHFQTLFMDIAVENSKNKMKKALIEAINFHNSIKRLGIFSFTVNVPTKHNFFKITISEYFL